MANTPHHTVWPVPDVYTLKPVAISGDGEAHYGARRTGGREHMGIDIGNREGDAVVAFAAGTVKVQPNNGGAGNTVTIDHGGGLSTRYFHLQDGSIDELLRRQNAGGEVRVEAGEQIGRIGTTGNAARLTPHLHFEVLEDGRQVDPAPYLRAIGPEAREALASLPRQTLREGSRGPAVTELQEFLNEAQARAGERRLDEDGRFGPGTRDAVQEFQRSQGLAPADGIVGRTTWEKIDEVRAALAADAPAAGRLAPSEPARDAPGAGAQQDALAQMNAAIREGRLDALPGLLEAVSRQTQWEARLEAAGEVLGRDADQQRAAEAQVPSPEPER